MGKIIVLTHLIALKGGMAETLPTGLGPAAEGIMTSRPGGALESEVWTGVTWGETALVGLKGRGL